MKKNKNNSKENINSKKNDVLRVKKDKKKYIVLTLFIAVVTGIVLVFSGGEKKSSVKAEDIKMIKASVTSEEISYNVTDFDDMKARHYEYKSGDVLIKYFILKSSDGNIRSAFDACDSCWRSGKGYTQQGDLMICNNCGLRFPSNKINEVRGGCNPVTLPTIIKGDKIVIKISDIILGKSYFNFRGRR
jgi:uncharacterized membrane protein